MKKIKSSLLPVGGDRKRHVTDADVLVVLSRLPDAACERLRAVHFNDRSRGNHDFSFKFDAKPELLLHEEQRFGISFRVIDRVMGVPGLPQMLEVYKRILLNAFVKRTEIR